MGKRERLSSREICKMEITITLSKSEVLGGGSVGQKRGDNDNSTMDYTRKRDRKRIKTFFMNNEKSFRIYRCCVGWFFFVSSFGVQGGYNEKVEAGVEKKQKLEKEELVMDGEKKAHGQTEDEKMD